ncbi:MAG: hypothetical protein ACJA09_000722 [Alcanivorax sp.]|jgi:hypothetical protein
MPPITGETLWRQLAQEVDHEKPQSVLLSSENFWFVDPANLPASLEDSYQVRVIAHIRRQDNVICSSFCEEVKREQISLDTDVESYALHSHRLGFLDYAEILRAWSQRFGAENINVRVYEHVSVTGISADLCSLLDVNFSELSIEESRVNPGLPYDVLSLISRSKHFKAGDAAKRRFVTALSESVVMLEPDAAYDTAGLFSLALRQKIMAHFEASNDEIFRNYIHDDATELFPALGNQELAAPDTHIDEKRMVQLLLGLHAQQEKANIRFLRRLTKLEREFEAQAKILADITRRLG